MSEPEPGFPPERKALHAALAAAQGEFPPIPRDRKVNVKTRDGGSYSFAYAPLDTILNTVRPVLAKHGLAVIQRLESPTGKPAIRTEILHADGGVIAASFPLGEMPASPQQLGSLITYLRRYAIVAMLGLAAEDDDDGQHAAGGHTTTTDAPVEKRLTDAQKKKLDVLVANLRDNGHISTEQLYGAVATLRGVERDQLVLEIGGVDDEGVLRWRRLREALRREEARQLIDRLNALEERVKTGEGSSPFLPPANVQVPFE